MPAFSENFLGKVERGDASVNWAKLFQVLDGLGIRLTVDVPYRRGVAIAHCGDIKSGDEHTLAHRRYLLC